MFYHYHDRSLHENRLLILTLIIAMSFLILSAWSSSTFALSKDIVFTIDKTVFSIDGTSQTMDVSPFIESGRTYVPVKYLANALGIADEGIVWNAKLQEVSLTKSTDVVKMKIGNKTLIQNGKSISMDTAPLIRNGRTFLPAKYVAEAFGYTVSWNATQKAVTVQQAVSVSKTYSISIANFAFDPPTLTINKGDTVTWTNQDKVRHNVEFSSFKAPLLNQGESYSHTFDEVGTFNYFCTPHPYMKANIIVK